MLTSVALPLHSTHAQQVMFLNELEELLELTQSPDFAKVAGGWREPSGASGGEEGVLWGAVLSSACRPSCWATVR